MTTMTTALPIITADPTLSSPINTNTLPPAQPYSGIDLEAAAQPSTTTTTTTAPNPHNPNPNPTTTAPASNRTSTSTTTSTLSIPWGPSHPCYPHPNPHVPLASPLSTKTRILRIPRDWMLAGDLAPQFSNIYPETLEPWVSESDFRLLVSTINAQLFAAFGADALDPNHHTATLNPNHNTTSQSQGKSRGMGNWTTWRDALLGVATGWLWEDLGGEMVGVKKGLRGLERWMEGWNREGGREEEGVRCVELRRTGYLCLDIQIPDPQLRVLDREEDDEEEGMPARLGAVDGGRGGESL